MTQTTIKVGIAVSAVALATAGSAMFGGVASAGTHTHAAGGSGSGGSDLPDMMRLVGGNSGAVCILTMLEGDISREVPLSDRALKRDVTPVVWSRSA